MLHIVYIDVLFFVNLIINYLILFAVGKLTGVVIHRIFILVAAAVGAAYCCAAYLFDMRLMWALVAKVVIGGVMVVIAYGVNRKFLRLFLSFCGVSFAFGGCVFAFFLLTDGAGGIINVKNGVYYLKVSLSTLLISAGGCYILINLVFTRCTAKGKGRGICEVHIRHMEKEIRFQAIVDSGNHLSDPLTNRRVVIVEYERIREVMSREAADILDEASPQEFPLCIDKLPSNYKFRLLPYKTVGCELDMLLAFKPDKVTIDGVDEKGILVAICSNRISDGGVYNAIVSDAA